MVALGGILINLPHNTLSIPYIKSCFCYIFNPYNAYYRISENL